MKIRSSLKSLTKLEWGLWIVSVLVISLSFLIENVSILNVIASLIGGMLRFVAHLLAGVIFFKEYAGDQNPWIYSIIYNCTYIIPSIILTAVVAVLILKTSPRLLKLA